MAKINTPWHAKGNERIRCPFPDCTHIAEVITKIHCRLEHGMERHEVEKLYGLPKSVFVKHPFKAGS
ncbi:hypothetical protein [Sporosarcina newyorkensis]|uniref:hypothetical protein n=1 Tax=Sporosarcina newyorkensis TaxID=759851 RepID=UPI003CFD8B96